MERKDMDIPADVEELFPEEILLAHYVEAWKFIVAFKQERGQRQWEQDLSFIPFFSFCMRCHENPSDYVYILKWQYSFVM